MFYNLRRTLTIASSSDITAVKTWVAIDVAKFTDLALMEFPDGKRKRFRFRHCAEGYETIEVFIFALPKLVNLR